jgi:hypothetical protein
VPRRDLLAGIDVLRENGELKISRRLGKRSGWSGSLEAYEWVGARRESTTT